MTTPTWVYSMQQSGRGAWSKYVFNFDIEAFALLGDTLYLRHGNYVNIVDDLYTSDYVGATEIVYAGAVQWSWLDMGMPGVTKMLKSFDIVSTSSVSPTVEFGYDQLNPSTMTTPYTIPDDSLTGNPIPFPMAAPSISPKLTWSSGPWTLNAFSLYVNDKRAGS